ncbi:MAG: ribbon-helix-helix protein, CopG family [Candidatus Dormibacteraeota bacterium]|nr:ribbon-helix-helix protein, CopG family [Candidatus Dormibacteraeota bacterium]MBO0760890.1 ribbon-helix-helix protein, CopG family [Candidatus Dormibacteraeota bacterium]
MKLSVSLPDEDVAFLDEYAAREGAPSRSSAIHEAIDMLRSATLEDAYATAWEEWEASEDAELWEATVSDGTADAPR